jgi:hypothetical protein
MQQIRGCKEKQKNKINNVCHVMGIVKPGSVIKTLISTAKSNMEKLTATDAIVFRGVTSDVSHNKSHEGLKHLINFVQSNSHTNITIMCVSHRYYLAIWSCINTEVKTFNRKREIHENLKHMVTIKTDLTREHFTRHGLHMNFWVKNYFLH